MTRLFVRNGIIHYSAWKMAYSGLSSFQVEQTVTNDLAQCNLSPVDIPNFIWIIDSAYHEGYGPTELENLYKFLVEKHKLNSKNYRALFGCRIESSKLPYTAIHLPQRCLYNRHWFPSLQKQQVEWQELPMNCLFVCLMRRPDISRAHVLKHLSNNFNLEDIMLSFGVTSDVTDHQTIDTLREVVHPVTIPIVIDSNIVSASTQHRIDHTLLYQTPLNFIVETANQIDPTPWVTTYVTEKSYKALAWHQFPIWYAVPGLVAEVRNQGYDVFDDLFENHYYDDIQDPWVRMTEVIKLLKKVTSSDLVALRKRHWLRLVQNAKMISQSYYDCMYMYRDAIEQLSNQ